MSDRLPPPSRKPRLNGLVYSASAASLLVFLLLYSLRASDRPFEPGEPAAVFWTLFPLLWGCALMRSILWRLQPGDRAIGWLLAMEVWAWVAMGQAVAIRPDRAAPLESLYLADLGAIAATGWRYAKVPAQERDARHSLAVLTTAGLAPVAYMAMKAPAQAPTLVPLVLLCSCAALASWLLLGPTFGRRLVYGRRIERSFPGNGGSQRRPPLEARTLLGLASTPLFSSFAVATWLAGFLSSAGPRDLDGVFENAALLTMLALATFTGLSWVVVPSTWLAERLRLRVLASDGYSSPLKGAYAVEAFIGVSAVLAFVSASFQAAGEWSWAGLYGVLGVLLSALVFVAPAAVLATVAYWWLAFERHAVAFGARAAGTESTD